MFDTTFFLVLFEAFPQKVVVPMIYYFCVSQDVLLLKQMVLNIFPTELHTRLSGQTERIDGGEVIGGKVISSHLFLVYIPFIP